MSKACEGVSNPRSCGQFYPRAGGSSHAKSVGRTCHDEDGDGVVERLEKIPICLGRCGHRQAPRGSFGSTPESLRSSWKDLLRSRMFLLAAVFCLFGLFDTPQSRRFFELRKGTKIKEKKTRDDPRRILGQSWSLFFRSITSRIFILPLNFSAPSNILRQV